MYLESDTAAVERRRGRQGVTQTLRCQKPEQTL